MLLNGIELIGYSERDDHLSFVLDCTMEDALALDKQALIITNNGEEYKRFEGYSVISVGINDVYVEMECIRKLDDATAGAIKTLESNVKKIEKNVESSAEKIKNIELSASGFDKRITQVKTNVDAASKDIETLKDEATSTTERIGAVETSVTKASEDVAELKAGTEDVYKRIDNAESTVTDMGDVVDSLETNTQAMGVKLDDVVKNVKELVGTSATEARAAIELALFVQAPNLTDDQVLSVSSIWHKWNEDAHYNTGVIVSYNEKLYRCAQEHDAQADWTPDKSPSLWSEVSFTEEGVEEWKQPSGGHDAYAKGKIVMYKGKKWESLVDNNVWEPGAVGSDTLWREVV